MGSCLSKCFFPIKHDSAESRRLELKTIELDLKHEPRDSNMKIVNEYIENKLGQLQYSKCYIPDDKKPIKAMICFVPGYGVHTDWLLNDAVLNFARRGYIVFTFDHIGHGRSDGLHCLIDDFEQFVLNTKHLCDYARKKYYHLANKQCFLLGASMGGAIAIRLSLIDVFVWSGLLLVAPMVYIDDNLKPHWLVTELLRKVLTYFPGLGNLPIAPVEDVYDNLSCDKRLIEHMDLNPMRYVHKPRLATAFQFLQATTNCCETWIQQIKSPFIVMHGKADKVTSCTHSQMLYDKSNLCKNKKIILYPDAWHMLFEERQSVIFDDCDQWMMKMKMKQVKQQQEQEQLELEP